MLRTVDLCLNLVVFCLYIVVISVPGVNKDSFIPKKKEHGRYIYVYTLVNCTVVL